MLCDCDVRCDKKVVRHLILAGHDVHVVSGAPDFVFTSEIQSTRFFIRKVS
jgi:L-arabinokinase